MADQEKLQALQTRLNQDDALRGEFLKDPVGALKKEGVTLTPDQANSVKAQIAELQLANLERIPAVNRPKIGISITITIRF